MLMAWISKRVELLSFYKKCKVPSYYVRVDIHQDLFVEQNLWADRVECVLNVFEIQKQLSWISCGVFKVFKNKVSHGVKGIIRTSTICIGKLVWV